MVRHNILCYRATQTTSPRRAALCCGTARENHMLCGRGEPAKRWSTSFRTYQATPSMP